MMKDTWWKYRKNIPLRKQQLVLSIATAVLMAIVIVLISIQYFETQRSNMISYQALYSDQVAHSTKQAYNAYKQIAYSVAYYSAVQDYIEQTEPARRYDAYQQVYSLLNNTLSINSNLMDIAVYSPAGNSISLTTSPSIYSRFADEMQTANNAFRSLGTLQVDGTLCHILSIPVCRLSSSTGDRYLGTVLLAINNDRFFNLNAQTNPNASATILLADEKNHLIYGSDSLFSSLPASTAHSENVTTVSIHGTEYMLRTYQVSESGAILYILFDMEENLHSILSINVALFVAFLIVLSILIISFLIIWLPVSTSLRDLTQLMVDASKNTEPELVPVDPEHRDYSCLETNEIFHTFSHMMNENSHLHQVILSNYRQMMELEVNNRQTEIAFLRSQINPHFLYNTLTTICGMSADGQNDEVIEVTEALASIFRYSIQGAEMVTLTEELSIIDAYLRIQSYRFEDRLQVARQVSPDTLSWKIPKMIIQPLIENAIVHGMEPSLKPCLLTLDAHCEEDCLIITVSDTGVGMPADQLESIREALEASTLHKSANAPDHLRTMDALHHSGIGLLNVNSRVVLHYGSAYALTIHSTQGEGTRLCIRIPAQVHDKGEQTCIPPS